MPVMCGRDRKADITLQQPSDWVADSEDERAGVVVLQSLGGNAGCKCADDTQKFQGVRRRNHLML